MAGVLRNWGVSVADVVAAPGFLRVQQKERWRAGRATDFFTLVTRPQ